MEPVWYAARVRLFAYGWQCVTHCCAVAAGGTLLKLGTHHRELQPSIDRLETVGVSPLGCCADGTLEADSCMWQAVSG